MALTILSNPSSTASVSNEMLFVINEATKANNETLYPNYKYVADIYVNSVIVARLKAVPDPTNHFGVFDVSDVLKNYAPSYGLTANYANLTETYDIKLTYQVKLGEEYADTLYTNLVTDSERTSYRTYVIKPRLTTNPINDMDGLAASNMPKRTQAKMAAYKDDKWFIVPFWGNASGTVISYELLDSAGSNVGGIQSTTLTEATKVKQINLGFQKIASALTAAQQATIAKLHFYTGSGTHYDVDYTCTRYPIITMAWLNPYGAYESYSFGLVSKKTKEISRKEFAQKNYQINSSGVVSYDANGVMYGSKKGFNTKTIVKLKLTSHLLNQYEYSWLADLFSSPDVYMYDSVIDRFVPVSVTDNNYEHRTYLNSRLVPLEFGIEFTDTYNSQLL